jgi:hypothetical protein
VHFAEPSDSILEDIWNIRTRLDPRSQSLFFSVFAQMLTEATGSQFEYLVNCIITEPVTLAWYDLMDSVVLALSKYEGNGTQVSKLRLGLFE